MDTDINIAFDNENRIRAFWTSIINQLCVCVKNWRSVLLAAVGRTTINNYCAYMRKNFFPSTVQVLDPEKFKHMESLEQECHQFTDKIQQFGGTVQTLVDVLDGQAKRIEFRTFI